MSKHSYSITNDIMNGKVNTASLFSEIIDSSITIALDYINTSDDVLNQHDNEGLIHKTLMLEGF